MHRRQQFIANLHWLSAVVSLMRSCFLITCLFFHRPCYSTIPYTWESDISQGNWWCSSLETNDFYPIQERHLDLYNAAHLSAHGFTTMSLCNFYFAAREPIVVDWIESWSADDPNASLSFFTRDYAWHVWNLIWRVSKFPDDIVATDVLPSHLVRLEFRNPNRRRVNFSVLVRPVGYVTTGGIEVLNGLETAAAIANVNSKVADTSYYGMESPFGWEIGLIVVSSCFGLFVIGIALYLLIVILCKPRFDFS